MIHELKCEKQFFDDCVEGRKPFEMREKRDRPFAVGDFLALNEVDCTDNKFDIQEIAKNMVVHRSDEGVVFYYTGRCALFVVSYVLDDPRFVKEGHCALGIRPCRARYSWSNESRVAEDAQYGAVVYDREGTATFTREAY